MVKESGSVAVIKFDGQRVENQYTVFISFPEMNEKEMIRADESTLRKAMIKVLTTYAENNR